MYLESLPLLVLLRMVLDAANNRRTIHLPSGDAGEGVVAAGIGVRDGIVAQVYVVADNTKVMLAKIICEEHMVAYIEETSVSYEPYFFYR